MAPSLLDWDRTAWRVIAAVGLLLVPSGARAVDTGDDAAEVRRCVEANFPERAVRQTIEVTSVDRAGGRRALEARVHWKRFPEGPRAMIRVDSPADVKDAAYLLIGGKEPPDVYVYMPAMKKVRRVTTTTASNQLWGTDFSYEDMRHLQGAAERGSVERLPDVDLEGRAAHVLETQLGAEVESVYERVRSYVDAESCVALRTEFYEQGAAPRKVLHADPSSLTRDGERWIATRFTMRDTRNETETELVIARSEMDAEIPDRVFNPSRLGRAR